MDPTSGRAALASQPDAGHRQTLACATNGTENQWVQVPPEHVSVQLGSYPGASVGNHSRRSLGDTRRTEVRRASPRAVTRVNPEQASKVQAVDADSALTRGRPPREGEAPTDAPFAVHRGSGNGTSATVVWCNVGGPRAARGRGAQRHRGCRSAWASERPVLPRKPGNAGGGKGPHFWVLLKEPRTRRLA
jgi:hypothetical protein